MLRERIITEFSIKLIFSLPTEVTEVEYIHHEAADCNAREMDQGRPVQMKATTGTTV